MRLQFVLQDRISSPRTTAAAVFSLRGLGQTYSGNRSVSVNRATAILHAVADRPLVHIQSYVIHRQHDLCLQTYQAVGSKPPPFGGALEKLSIRKKMLGELAKPYKNADAEAYSERRAIRGSTVVARRAGM